MERKTKFHQLPFDKQNFTISQFKFAPNKLQTILTGRSKHEQQIVPVLSRTLQNWRNKNVYRQDKEKRKQRGQNRGLFIESTPNDRHSNMFLTWHDRSSSTRHFQTISQTIVREVVKNNSSEHGYSQKRLPSIPPSIEMHRLKSHNANRIVESSPIELITRKLEWEGRKVKRIVPHSMNKPQLKFSVSAKLPQTQNEKKALQRQKISGWQRHNIDLIQQMQF